MTPDLIDALHGFQGVTIRVRHPLAPASMRLLDTLGATVEIDPSAPECVRFAGKFSHALKPGGCVECARVERASVAA